jgi:hypothetical protein
MGPPLTPFPLILPVEPGGSRLYGQEPVLLCVVGPVDAFPAVPSTLAAVSAVT